ncbi:helix-turn-helix transcriptional regulator [Thiohalocapsa marina]|uniref:Helix-turn-helix transcriptional regulator n=1 Tax=Thiohalocapsa marina TaxID=424902 RepID=A0A5M8FN54_9GAMM|nr:helix-turn-helix transcriptional regulator [Thiohalocapsa marina]KAA6186207.1 helix-turn-helix transcriptional regulator [Thiohalocapsa marina]
MKVQTIDVDGAPALVVLPIDEWQAMQARLEELEDIIDGRSAQEEETFPAGFVDRLLAGESPLRVWREHRGMTLQVLAERCETSRQMLSMVENQRARPSADLLARLARALNCATNDLHDTRT